MPIEEILALRCCCVPCGHQWISEQVPARCAKCKSRKWNAGAEEYKPVQMPVVETRKEKRSEPRPIEWQPLAKGASAHLGETTYEEDGY